MFPTGEDNCFSEKKEFCCYSIHKIVEAILLDLGRDIFGCGGGGCGNGIAMMTMELMGNSGGGRVEGFGGGGNVERNGRQRDDNW